MHSVFNVAYIVLISFNEKIILSACIYKLVVLVPTAVSYIASEVYGLNSYYHI